MATLVAQGICCCFSCCCQGVSDALQRWLGPAKVAKVFYLFLVMIFTIPAIVVLFYLNRWEDFNTYFSWLSCPNGGGHDCVGSAAIYRMSLSLLILFGLMMLITMCRSRFAMVINEGVFCMKYLLVVGFFVGFLWVKNDTFNQYATASKYISIIFMIMESIILIDLFYLAGIKLVAKYDQGQTGYAGVLIFLTILAQTLAILLNIMGYIYFSKQDSCGNSLWVNVVNTIILIILPVLQIFNFNKQNSLLTTALVSMYISYLAFVCQYSYGGNTCSARMTTGSLALDIIVSTFFFILTTYGSIMGGSGQVKVTQNTDLNAAIGGPTDTTQRQKQHQGKQQIRQQQQNKGQAQNQLVYTQTWTWPKWHFFMSLASIYIGMLITNWSSANILQNNLISNDFGFWVRVIISWATTLLYIWTLIAPRLFPDRDFTVV